MPDQSQNDKRTGSDSRFRWRSDELDDFIMKRIYEAYDIKEEPEEDGEQEEEDDSELNALSSDETYPIYSDEPPDTWTGAVTAFWTSLPTLSKLLTWFIFIWPLSYFIAKFLFREMNSMDNAVVTLLLVLPSSILMGINGLLILFNQSTDEAASQARSGSFRFLVGIFSLLVGWGVAVYFAWIYFVPEL